MNKLVLAFALYGCGNPPAPAPATPPTAPRPVASSAPVEKTAPPVASAAPDVAPPAATVIVGDLKAPERLMIAGGNLYWIDRKLLSVMTAPLAGGEAKPFAANQKGIEEIAVDATAVYWTTSDGKGGGSIMKLGLKGGTPQKLAAIAPSDLGGPMGIDVSASAIYFVVSMNSGSVMKLGLLGGAPTPIASKLHSPYDIAASGSDVFWTELGAGAADGRVMGRGAKDEAPRVIADKQRTPWWIATDGKDVYWIAKGPPGALMKAPAAGGAPTALAADIKSPSCLLLDGDWVYFGSDEQDFVRKVKKDGTSPITIAEKQKSPSGLAISGDNVYWTDRDGGTIHRAAK